MSIGGSCAVAIAYGVSRGGAGDPLSWFFAMIVAVPIGAMITPLAAIALWGRRRVLAHLLSALVSGACAISCGEDLLLALCLSVPLAVAVLVGCRWLPAVSPMQDASEDVDAE